MKSTARLTLRRAVLLTALGIALGYSLGWRPLWTAIEGHSSFRTTISLFLIGNDVVQSDEIFELLSIDENQSVAKLNISLLKRQISSHPWVKEVNATVLPPNKLILRISERVPVARVLINSNLWWVDSEGIPFARSSPTDHSTPRILGIENPESGVPHELLKEASQLNSSLNCCEKLPSLISIRIAEDLGRENPTLLFEGDILVKMGRGEREAKLRRLDALFDELDTDELLGSELDLRFGERVILRGATLDSTLNR